MLGSLHDADDALQDTLLRAWRALPGFGGRSSFRTWLYRIATNVCLDALARRTTRVLPIDYGPVLGPGHEESEQPLADSLWIEPYPDGTLGVADGAAGPDARYERREALELAFVAALQHLPPRQRAVLILRDVLGFSAREASEALDTTVASVNGALQRSCRAARLRGFATSRPVRNGQVALGTYQLDHARGGFVPLALDVLTLRDDLVADVTAFRNPAIFPRFGLPDIVAGPQSLQ